MEIEISKIITVTEISLFLMTDGKSETVIRFLDICGNIVRQVKVSNLEDALECIRKQGE